jgi:hypothetical protein
MNETYTNTRTPLFLVNEEIYKELSDYDIENYDDNFTINLIYFRFNDLGQGKITLYASIGIFLTLCIATATWHILTFKIYPADSTILQKSFTAMLYLKLILSALTVYYNYLFITKVNSDSFGDAIMIVYVETISSTLNAVLQTLLLFIVLMIAYGWQIYRGIFTRNELRNAVLVFILLYVLICFDQIMDILIDVNIWEVIKNNLIIYLFNYLFNYLISLKHQISRT